MLLGGLLSAAASGGVWGRVARAADDPPAEPPALPAAEPNVAALLPAGLTRGSSVEVTVTGTNLTSASAVRVTGDGIAAELVPLPQGRTPNPRQLTVKLTATTEAKPGFRELRIVTPGGASNVARFVVGTLPEVVEKEPNDTSAVAMPLEALPVVVNGAIDRGEDRDCFRFAARAGQTLVLDLCGHQLHPYIANQRPGWLEGLLTVREYVEGEPAGERSNRSLAYAQDFPGREDPLLIFTAPKDGQYVVEVRDDLYRGRPEFNYRLTIGALPYVTATFPAGGKRGAATSLELVGVNLGDRKALPLVSDAQSPLGKRLERLDDPLANSFALELSDDVEVLETEPNDIVKQAVAIPTPALSIPVIMNGRIERDGDVDSFKFTASKGQRYFIETISRSFGSPLDARLELLDAQGRRLKENDDANSAFDSLIDNTFAADGEYVIRVSDTTGVGGPRHVYRLSVRQPRPDFTLTVSPDNPRVTAGGSAPLKVRVQRRDGFSGDIELSVPAAPHGAVIPATLISGGATEQLLVVTVPADAACDTLALEVFGKAKIGEQEVVRKAVPAEQVRYVNDWRYVDVNDVVLSVLPKAPVTLSWGVDETTVASGATVQVPIKVQRAPGFTGAVRVVVEGLPPRVAAPPVTIEENATEATIEIRSSNGAPANLSQAIANGTVTLGGRTFVQSSPGLRVKVEAPVKK